MSKEEIMALTIWWCEGAKARRDFRWLNAYLYPVEVTNTDPKIIKIFIDYIKKVFKLTGKEIKGQLQIHEGDDKDNLENFWSKQTGIPITQFNKTIIRKKGSRYKKTKGTFKVRLYNKQIFFELQRKLKKIQI